MLEEPTEDTIFAMMFPTRRIESERDLPLYIRNGKSSEKRIRRLNSDRMKHEILSSEYDAYLKIIKATGTVSESQSGEQD
jgi:hypothetical protein